MSRFAFLLRPAATLPLLICFVLSSPALLPAQAPVKIQRMQGVVDLSTTPPTMAIEGIASHLGRFMGRGQVVFALGEDPGTMTGTGPVVLRAANGDLLVGGMTWTLGAAGEDGSREASIHFRWSDFVVFHDGSVVANTGRFVRSRPPGLVVIEKTEPSPDNLLIRLIKAILR